MIEKMIKRLLILLALTGCGGGEDELVQCTPEDNRFLCEPECVRAPEGDPNVQCAATNATTRDTTTCAQVSELDGVKGCCDVDEDSTMPIVFRWFECEGQ